MISMSKRQKSQTTPTRGRPACPDYVAGAAAVEFSRVCDELDQMGTLTTADVATIAMYALNLASYAEAQRELSANGKIVASPKTGVPMHNLWRTVANDCETRIEKCAWQLGLTPRARQRLAAEQNGGDAGDDFSDLG